MTSLEPLRLLKLNQPREYERIFAVAWLHYYGFPLYLALGDYKKCIESKELAARFDTPALVARVLLVLIVTTCIYLGVI